MVNNGLNVKFMLRSALDEPLKSSHHLKMAYYTDDDLHSLNEPRYIIGAAMALARLDEALLRTDKSEVLLTAGIRRREAISIASLEGSLVRMDALCRLLGDRQVTRLDRSVRLAADIHDALMFVEGWSALPTASDIRKVFDLADASAGRSLKQDLIWSLEDSCTWLVDEIASFNEFGDKQNPWDAIELLRVIWGSGRFLGAAKRMALVLSSWILAKGFKCQKPVVGLAAYIATDLDRIRDASQDRMAWLSTIGLALTSLGFEHIAKLEDGKATKLSMLALCPPVKSSSSVERAIEFMMANPVFPAKALELALDVTRRGAKDILDKLEEADVVEVDGGLKNRTFVCRRAM